MTTTLTVDLFISTDGFAGPNGLPGYLGYSGPDLATWIADSAAPTVSVMGRRTYEMLALLPEEHRDEGWEQMAQLKTVVSGASPSLSSSSPPGWWTGSA